MDFTFGDFSDVPYLANLLQETSLCKGNSSTVRFREGSVPPGILKNSNAIGVLSLPAEHDTKSAPLVEETECNDSRDILTVDESGYVRDDDKPRAWSSLFPAGSSAGIITQSVSYSDSGNQLNSIDPGDLQCFKLCVATFEADHHARAAIPPRGLINRSNTCYINSVLQVLLLCPPISALLRTLNLAASQIPQSSLPPVLESLLHIFSDLTIHEQESDVRQQDLETLLSSVSPLDPLPLLRMLEKVPGHSLRPGVQEDAEEFLSFLLSTLHEELAGIMTTGEDIEEAVNGSTASDDDEWAQVGRKNKPVVTRNHGTLAASALTKLIGGRLRSVLSATNGKRQSDALQPFLVLPLCIDSESVNNLNDALLLWNKAERVEDSSQKKQLFLDILPQLLFVQLKCFVFMGNGPAKILKSIQIPSDLDIPSSLLSGDAKTNRSQSKKYRLYGVIYHWGQVIGKGHYTAAVFHNALRKWLVLDDKIVRLSKLEEVLACRDKQGCMPYILCYRRLDTVTNTNPHKK